MRHDLITALYKEFVGPRDGAAEVLSSDPLAEYQVGQIHPLDSEKEPEEQAQVNLTVGPVGEEDGTSDAPSLIDAALIDAGRKFRQIPSSFGISFILKEAPKDGEVSVCLTWARYTKEGNAWTRKPKIWIHSFDGKKGTSSIVSEDETVELYFHLHLNRSVWKCSIFFVSRVFMADRKIVKTEDVIYQPEIRISLSDTARMAPLGESGFSTVDPDWRLATKQYDNLCAYARGHMCSVYWSAIDPQREPPRDINKSSQPPFIWVDGQHFKESQSGIERFFVPTLRTEFVPMYPSPSTPKTSSEVNPPIVSASAILECKSPENLKSLLEPFANTYLNWLDFQRRKSNSIDEINKQIFDLHMNSIERIMDGIDFLATDPSCYESFLFMNKAMQMQYEWTSGKKDMEWRPFQLAFILLSIRSAVSSQDKYRDVCDTIWFPTGGGKTEAYLGLTAFVLSYRRRISRSDVDGSKGGEGLSVLSRYTLRLLTIQQYRRALKMITACELLRCEGFGASRGWTNSGRIKNNTGWIWGRSPFSIGLWVGSGVTPNQMRGEGWGNLPQGAVVQLRQTPGVDNSNEAAQILNCPVCETILSLSPDGFQKGEKDFHFISRSRSFATKDDLRNISTEGLNLTSISFQNHPSGKIFYGKMKLNFSEGMKPSVFVKWWNENVESSLRLSIVSFNPARPGYVPSIEGRGKMPTDFEIRCPNSDCELNKRNFRSKIPISDGKWDWKNVHELFATVSDQRESVGIPIPAITVDEKLYFHPPSMVISTCDKVVLTSFMADAASLFGKINSYDLSIGKGFSQRNLTESSRLIPCDNFNPPDLIIQDELHLLEGPLGSTFGLFEIVIDKLAKRPKYIASSATIRKSAEQVACILGRRSSIFPPPSLDIAEGFFLKQEEVHPLDESRSGRLFLGLAFPGRAPQTPTVRTWGTLLQAAQDMQENELNEQIDPYWTLVGYFNAVRELAQAETYWRQDISGFLDYVYGRRGRTGQKRNVLERNYANLSSQTNSGELPGILSRLERAFGSDDCLDGVLTTSMFGTGVDVSRLSAMIVHGQPKASSQYIQAVGRIGRSTAGLAVTLFRVSKPRDLNHYEYFTGYHRRLPVAVEPITVRPMSSKGLEKMIGPMMVSLVRNWNSYSPRLDQNISAEEGAILAHRIPEKFWEDFVEMMLSRWREQPDLRKYLLEDEFKSLIKSKNEQWTNFSKKSESDQIELRYSKGDYSVLGTRTKQDSLFPDAPKSLRDVESMIRIYIDGSK